MATPTAFRAVRLLGIGTGTEMFLSSAPVLFRLQPGPITFGYVGRP
jgi:hypothetical protein